jgi:hypothetical protein
MAQIPSFGSLYRSNPGLSKSVHFGTKDSQPLSSDKVQSPNESIRFDSIRLRPAPGSIKHFEQALIAEWEQQLRKDGRQESVEAIVSRLYSPSNLYKSRFPLPEARKIAIRAKREVAERAR